MRIVFDKCLMTKVFPSDRNPKRLYIDLVDLDTGAPFTFSSDSMDYKDAALLVHQIGSLTGRFETYLWNDTKSGQVKLQFKATEVVFKPAK